MSLMSSAVSPAAFRDTLGRFGSGVVVVAGAGPAGLACQSFFAVSLDPPLVAVSPSVQSASGWEPAPSGSPFIHGALAWLDCRICAVHEAGDHYLVVGEVLHLAAAGAGDPLVFFRGAFGTFAAGTGAVPQPAAPREPADDVWRSGPWQEGLDW